MIQEFIAETGMLPTRAEIARELGFKSANAAEEHLRALQKKGVLELLPGPRVASSSRIPRDQMACHWPSPRAARFLPRSTSRRITNSIRNSSIPSRIICCTA